MLNKGGFLTCPQNYLAILTAAAVAVFIVAGIGRPIWADDANGVLMASHDFAGLMAALRADNNLPAYYILLFGWMKIFGDSEVALRALSILFYFAGAAVSAVLATAIHHSRRVGFYAAVLYLASAQAVRQAQSVRMYTMLGFLSALSLLLFWRIFVQERRSKGYYAGWVIVNSIGVLTQVWFFFVLFAQFVCFVACVRREWRRLLILLPIPGIVFAVVWGQTFVAQLGNKSTAWLPRFQFWFVLDALMQFYGGYPAIGMLFLVLCAIPVALAPGRMRLRFWRHRGTRVLLIAFACCLLTPIALSAIKPVYYPARYTTIALPALAVLLAGVFARLAPRLFAVGACSLVLLCGAGWRIKSREAVGDPAWDYLPAASATVRSDRATAEYILRHGAPGDAIVFTNITRATADYYLRRLGAGSRFAERSFPADLDHHQGWFDPASALKNGEALDAEASGLAATLGKLSTGGAKIWVYHGPSEVPGKLKSRLDRELGAPARHAFSGPYHQELLEYAGSPRNSAIAR